MECGGSENSLGDCFPDKHARMAARNAVHGARSTSLARQGHAQHDPERGVDEQTQEIRAIHCPAGDCKAICREGRSPEATSGTRPCCPSCATRSPSAWRSDRSPLTEPAIRASAMTPSPTAAPMPFVRETVPGPFPGLPHSRPARLPSRGSHQPQAPLPATRPCAHRDTSAAPSGENGADTTAEAAPRRNLSGHCGAMPCRSVDALREALGAEPSSHTFCECVAGRRMARDFDRQVAELQIRAAVLNGYTALAIPITGPMG